MSLALLVVDISADIHTDRQTDRRGYSINILETRVSPSARPVVIDSSMCTVDGGTVKGYWGMVRKPISRYYIHVNYSFLGRF